MKCPIAIFILFVVLLTGCRRQPPQHTFTHEVLLPMTPVKNQGKTELCWAYAMLATIETEHLLRGDSVNLSPQYLGRMLKRDSQRAMCQTALNLMERYGMVGYDVMPDDATTELPTPRWVFMLGAQYTPLEFAHSVCAPGEYLSLTCVPDSPYYKKVVVPVPDNWERNRLLNVPLDTLRRHINHALKHRHPVCWESAGHAMAIVGMARDENKRPYYILKNSWGRKGPHEGFVYMPARRLWRDMVAVYLTREAYYGE
ncbi:MAG: C1 family peptidase [Bacteroidaceae bacterium]|nr:C1 family peptidase [Bacteroidaceae bacterium]